jgi:hypothetical protein
MDSTADTRQLLERLAREQEQLCVMGAMIDSHAQEFVSAIQRKRSHLANIASLAPGIALARQCHDEIGEYYSGAEYHRMITHIEGSQVALANRRRDLSVRIERLRHQLATADPLTNGNAVTGV